MFIEIEVRKKISNRSILRYSSHLRNNRLTHQIVGTQVDHNVILVKTEKGFTEVSTRQYKLDSRLRTILIIIDGKKTFKMLVDMLSQINTVKDDILALIEKGFIKGVVDFKIERKALSRALTDLLGPNADYLTMQLEECESIDELTTLIEEKREMLEAALGARGKVFWDILKSITG